MFINQYKKLKILLKSSSTLTCLFIYKYAPYIVLSNGYNSSILRLPLKKSYISLLRYWQACKINKIIFIDGNLEQKYLINKSKLIFSNALCLKTLFFILKSNHLSYSFKIKFYIKSFKGLLNFSKYLFILFEKLSMIARKKKLKLLKYNTYQVVILSNMFTKGIPINLFLLKNIIYFKYLEMCKLQLYYSFHEANRSTIIYSLKQQIFF